VVERRAGGCSLALAKQPRAALMQGKERPMMPLLPDDAREGAADDAREGGAADVGAQTACRATPAPRRWPRGHQAGEGSRRLGRRLRTLGDRRHWGTRDRAPARTRDRVPARTRDRAPARTRDRAPARTRDRSPARTRDRAPARATSTPRSVERCAVTSVQARVRRIDVLAFQYSAA
jgi:hypothetical protein